MLIYDKDITSYQLLLKQDRVLVNQVFASLTGESGFFLFFFDFLKKMGRSDDGKRNILLGWPNLYVLWRCKSRENVLVYDLFIFNRQCIHRS